MPGVIRPELAGSISGRPGRGEYSGPRMRRIAVCYHRRSMAPRSSHSCLRRHLFVERRAIDCPPTSTPGSDLPPARSTPDCALAYGRCGADRGWIDAHIQVVDRCASLAQAASRRTSISSPATSFELHYALNSGVAFGSAEADRRPGRRTGRVVIVPLIFVLAPAGGPRSPLGALQPDWCSVAQPATWSTGSATRR